MKIVGYAFAEGREPIVSGYLALDDLTILLGPNDSGKTQALAALEQTLRGNAIPAPEVTGLFGPGPYLPPTLFFASATRDELAALVEWIAPLESHGERKPLGASSSEAAGGMVSAVRAKRAEDPMGDVSEPDRRVNDAIASALPAETAGRDRIVEFVAETGLLAFELLLSDEELPSWRVHYCLPPFGGLSSEIRSMLAEANLGTSGPRGGQEDANSSTFAEAPIRIGVLGETRLPLLPQPIAVPRLFEYASKPLEDALGEAQFYLGQVGVVDDSSAPYDINFTRTDDWDPWLQQSEDASTVALSPFVVPLCRSVGLTATALLPDFVSSKYEVRVEPNPIHQWSTRGRTRLMLSRRADGSSFPVEDVAAGYKLWLQLAIFETIALVERYALLLGELFGQVMGHGEDPERFMAAVGALEHGRLDQVEFGNARGLTAPALAMRDESRPDDPDDILRLARPRFYLIDEPEQHLHPRLERAAARWLKTIAGERGSQAVVATHSPSFLNASGASFIYFNRTNSQTKAEPFKPELLTALTEIASDLGFNRGELLANVNVVLFVEGRHDQRVLEALFGPRLHEIGVAVVPISGTARASGIIDSEVLLRYVRVKAAVLFDNLKLVDLQQLQNDAQFLEKSLSGKKGELKDMAQLVKNAKTRHAHIELFSHPAKDVFDLLDEGVLQRKFPTFPGHDRSFAEWEEQREKGIHNRKAFYEQRYDIPWDSDTYTEIADLMRVEGLFPPELVHAIDEVERYALGTD